MEKPHWKLWHLGLKMYIPWNDGRLRCFLREPMLRMENMLWNGSDLVTRVEAHWFKVGEEEVASRLSLLEISSFNYQIRKIKKRPSSPAK
jgi:hypothetical protein